MDNEEIPNDELLPCGCLIRCSIENGAKQLTVSPCHVDCLNYRNLVGLAKEQNKPIEYKK